MKLRFPSGKLLQYVPRQSVQTKTGIKSSLFTGIHQSPMQSCLLSTDDRPRHGIGQVQIDVTVLLVMGVRPKTGRQKMTLPTPPPARRREKISFS